MNNEETRVGGTFSAKQSDQVPELYDFPPSQSSDVESGNEPLLLLEAPSSSPLSTVQRAPGNVINPQQSGDHNSQPEQYSYPGMCSFLRTTSEEPSTFPKLVADILMADNNMSFSRKKRNELNDAHENTPLETEEPPMKHPRTTQDQGIPTRTVRSDSEQFCIASSSNMNDDVEIRISPNGNQNTILKCNKLLAAMKVLRVNQLRKMALTLVELAKSMDNAGDSDVLLHFQKQKSRVSEMSASFVLEMKALQRKYSTERSDGDTGIRTRGTDFQR